MIASRKLTNAAIAIKLCLVWDNGHNGACDCGLSNLSSHRGCQENL